MTTPYRRYYDLESYLFGELSPRFHREGSIGAFDFFSIIIWKANRAKTKTARRLRKEAQPGETLDALCRRLTKLIHDAPSDKVRFTILVSPPWSFALPMASAILTVLYAEVFTIYDYRVREELGYFSTIGNTANIDELWCEYTRYIETVRNSTDEGTLRDKDKELWGRSFAKQLEHDINVWFEKPPLSPSG